MDAFCKLEDGCETSPGRLHAQASASPPSCPVSMIMCCDHPPPRPCREAPAPRKCRNWPGATQSRRQGLLCREGGGSWVLAAGKPGWGKAGASLLSSKAWVSPWGGHKDPRICLQSCTCAVGVLRGQRVWVCPASSRCPGFLLRVPKKAGRAGTNAAPGDRAASPKGGV